MLQPSFLTEHKEQVIAGLKKRAFEDLHVVDEILELEEKRKNLKFNLDETNHQLNQSSKEIGNLFAQDKQEDAEALKEKTLVLKDESKKMNEELHEVETDLRDKLILIPNIPHKSVPEGTNAEQNEKVFQVDALPDMSDGAKPHWELMEQYDLVDFSAGNKITGAGFPLYKKAGAKLQRALINFFLDSALEAGYEEVIPPHLVNEETAFGTGQLPDKEGQMYELKEEKYFLIPTAEVPITNIFRDVLLKGDELPVKRVAYSPCFRREAGSYGKDVRGLNRVHQFDKVEIVQISTPDKSYEILEEMVTYVEGLLNKLELPYRIMKLCAGDMSFTAALTYDMEVFSGAQDRWLEVSSISNFESFQSNRMKLRYKDDQKKTHLAHTLNGSALALPRIVAALLENNQTDDGINIPEVLRPYTGFDRIK